MRVSTQGAFQSGLSLMQRLQSALDHTQRQIASGRRILRPSDDPIASGRALQMRESIARLEQFDRNANVAANRLHQEETVLSSVNNTLQRVRELALQASNATQSHETRQLIAVEMRERLDELVQLANQRDGNGRFLFAGNHEATQPVVRNGSTFSYVGDQGQRMIQIGEGRQVADGDSGSAVFFDIRDGNGTFATTANAANAGTVVAGATSVTDPSAWVPDQYSLRFIDANNYEVLDSSASVIASGPYQPGDTVAFAGIELELQGSPIAGDSFTIEPSQSRDVFSSVAEMVAAIESGPVDDVGVAAMTNRVNASLRNIDQAIGNMLDIRTQVGSRLAAIDAQEDSNAGFVATFQETLADIEDLDYAEAISRLSLQMTTLEAAQQSFVRTQSLSLFNYL